MIEYDSLRLKNPGYIPKTTSRSISSKYKLETHLVEILSVNSLITIAISSCYLKKKHFYQFNTEILFSYKEPIEKFFNHTF